MLLSGLVSVAHNTKDKKLPTKNAAGRNMCRRL